MAHPSSDDVHVIPNNDVLLHEFDDCACVPFIESCGREDGSYGWLIVHNAWDDRPE